MKKFFATLVLLTAAFCMCASVCAETDESTVSPILFHFGAVYYRDITDESRTNCVIPGTGINYYRNYLSGGEEYIGFITYDKEYIEFSLDFKNNDVFPSVDDLSKYPILVFGLENFSSGGICTLQYETSGYDSTDGKATMNTMLQPLPDSTVYVFDTSKVTPYFDGDSADEPSGDAIKWANKLEGLTIKFGSKQTVSLKYIGFFPDMETAAHADLLAKLEWREFQNDYKLTIPSSRLHLNNGVAENYTYDADGTISDADIFEMIKYNYYYYSAYDTYIDDNFSAEITDKVMSVAGTADNVGGTNGSFKAQIYLNLKDGDDVRKITVGKPIAGTIRAERYFADDIEILGAQIRKDGTDDALRFGFKVNVGDNRFVKTITTGTNGFFELDPVTESNTSLSLLGAYIVPKFALPDGGLTPEEFFTRLHFGSYGLCFKCDDGQDVDVARIFAYNIFSTAADNFVYTAVVTDIADPSTELVVYPFMYYDIKATRTYNLDSCHTILSPVTRSVDDVIEKLGNNQTQNWDK